MLQTLKDATTPKEADEPAVPLRLMKLRKEAAQLIKNQIKIGQAIKSQRISYVQDLEEARGEKQEWVTRTTDLLKQLFSDGSVAEQCNDWVGPILPEYAEFDLFVEQFINEMRHRMARLQMLLKRLEDFPEPESPKAGGTVRSIEKDEVRMLAPALTATPATPNTAPARSHTSGLLIVRMNDEQLSSAVAQFLEKLELTVHTIDQRPADTQKPLHAALEEHHRAAFALILNEANNNDGNYLFDLGCCVGAFGAGRLCVLQRNNTPPAGEDRGVRHIALDGACGWQLLLAKHLKTGGVTIDLNRLV